MANDRLVPGLNSFLKYEDPLPADDERAIQAYQHFLKNRQEIEDRETESQDPCAVNYMRELKKCLQEDRAAPLTKREFLDLVFEPTFTMVNGIRCMRRVSKEQASRAELVQILNTLNEQFERREAQANGVCPVRHELNFNFFDEVLRQLVIECNLRGYLLLQIIAEYKMSVDGYKEVLDTSISEEGVAFRGGQDKEEKEEMIAKIQQYESEISKLRKTVTTLEQEIELKENEFEELELLAQSVPPEVKFLMKIKEQYDKQMTFFENPPPFEEYLPVEEEGLTLI